MSFCSLFDVFVLTSQYRIPDEQLMSGSFVYFFSRFNVQNVSVIANKDVTKKQLGHGQVCLEVKCEKLKKKGIAKAITLALL